MNNNIEGGEVINAGGYGCIFRPSLKCDSSTRYKSENSNKYISKLLLNKHAEEEISEINRIKPIILQIPNNEKYFLLKNIEYCQPGKLTSDDLNNLEKCDKFFEKANLDKNNLNNDLDKFTIVNIPYGGNDLEKYIYSHDFKIDNFVNLNNNLIQLLNEAILPMIELQLIHMDLKDQNMLYQKDSIKIIDWGLSFIKTKVNYQYNKDNLFNNLYRRPLQFNLPYSILLLNEDFWKDFTNYFNYYITIEKKEIDSQFFKHVFKHILNGFFENIRYGHNIDLTNNIIPLLYDDENLSSDSKKYEKFIDIFTKIYSAIFEKFYDKKVKKFKINDYINEIYLYNCDIFGLVSVYISIYEKFKKLDYKNIDLTHLKKIIKKYMFEERFYTEKYNIEELNNDLLELNKIYIKEKTKKKITHKKKKIKIGTKKREKKI